MAGDRVALRAPACSDAAIFSKQQEIEQLVAAEQQRIAQVAEVSAAASLSPNAAADTVVAVAGADAEALDVQTAAEGRAPDSMVLPGLPGVGARRYCTTHLALSSVFDEEMIEETAAQQLQHTKQQASTSQGRPETSSTQQEEEEGKSAAAVEQPQAGITVPVASVALLSAHEAPGRQPSKPQGKKEKKQAKQVADAAAAAVEKPAAATTVEEPASGVEKPAAATGESAAFAKDGSAAVDGAMVETNRDGSLSFRFACSAPSSNSMDEGGRAAGLLPSAHDLAKRRLVSLLPPQAAKDLQRQLSRMSSGAGASLILAAELSTEFEQQLVLEQPPEQAQEAKPAGQQAFRLSPSARSTSAVGGPSQPAAASSGEDLPGQQRRRARQPKQPRQKQPMAGSVSLPRMADEPPNTDETAATPATEDVPVLAPPPVPAAPSTTAQHQQPDDVLRLFATPDVGAPLGSGVSAIGIADGYTAVTLRPSLPSECLPCQLLGVQHTMPGWMPGVRPIVATRYLNNTCRYCTCLCCLQSQRPG